MRKVKRSGFQGPTKSARLRDRENLARLERSKNVLNELLEAKLRRDIEEVEIERLVVKARELGAGWPKIAIMLDIDPSTAWRRWGRGEVQEVTAASSEMLARVLDGHGRRFEGL